MQNKDAVDYSGLDELFALERCLKSYNGYIAGIFVKTRKIGVADGN